jgi:hypothetical protein
MCPLPATIHFGFSFIPDSCESEGYQASIVICSPYYMWVLSSSHHQHECHPPTNRVFGVHPTGAPATKWTLPLPIPGRLTRL